MSGVNMSYQNVANTLGQASSTAESNLGNVMKTMDPNSASDLAKLQTASQQWSLVWSLNSNIMKMLGDSLKALVQNIR
jgi:type III secretion apparatus needle protein